MVGSASTTELLLKADRVAFRSRMRARCLILFVFFLCIILLVLASYNGVHNFVPPGTPVMVDFMQGSMGPNAMWVVLGGIGYGFGPSLALCLIMPSDTIVIRILSFFLLFMSGVCPWFLCMPLAITNMACSSETVSVAANLTITNGGMIEHAEAVGAQICLVEVIIWMVAAFLCFLASVHQLTALRFTCRNGTCDFAVPPRKVLTICWTTGRVIGFAFFCSNATTIIVLGILAPGYFETLPFRFMLCSLIGNALSSFPWTPAFRRRIQTLAYNSSSSTAQRREAKAAATVAALVGKVGRNTALQLARENFRSLAIDDLHEKDFESNTDARGLFERTSKARLGDVDAFMSHSWSDPGEPKFGALKAWAVEEGVDAGQVWLDKACIDQERIEASLACLPVFLAGCKKLLVVAGPTYVSRLWCIIELYTFLRMGGTLSRIRVIPVEDSMLSGTAASSQEWAADYFRNFDVCKAKCFKQEDEQHLLGVIESGFGSFNGFNQIVRDTFVETNAGKKLVEQHV